MRNHDALLENLKTLKAYYFTYSDAQTAIYVCHGGMKMPLPNAVQ